MESVANLKFQDLEHKQTIIYQVEEYNCILMVLASSETPSLWGMEDTTSGEAQPSRFQRVSAEMFWQHV